MNKQQKELLQASLDSEKEVLNNLKKNYKDALDEIDSKIEALMARQDADMQHVIYQVEYQKALKTQVQSILEQLQTNSFETVSEYLTKCYEDGFIGTMYDLQGQGVPLVIPIDQEQIVAAIQHETKLSEDLYTSLGKDIKDLQKKISSEISRGISTGQMFSEISRNIAGYAGISRNNAMRIARTEGHRIQIQATVNAQNKAKEKGADVVKQWDASLDGKTRDTHRKLDGQIRELDEDFEVDGMKAEAPGMFGIAAEDINCRCALLQRARWALGNDYTKWSPDAPVVVDDEGGTTQLIKIDASNMKEFKGIYRDITGQMTMNMGYSNQSVRSGSQKISGQNTLDKAVKKSTIKSLDVDDFKIMANHNDILPEVSGTIADTIKAFEDKGGMFISDMHFGEFYDEETGKPALLQVFANAYGQVEINVNSMIMGGKTLKEIDEIISSTKTNKPKNLIEAVVHECGHAKAYYRKTPQQIAEMNKAIKNKGVPGISIIAEADGAECIAETEVLLYRNEKVPAAAMKLYRKYVRGK